MAANTLAFYETNGAVVSAAVTAITNINYGMLDSPNINTTVNKISVNFNAYAKWIQFVLTTKVASQTDGNFKVTISTATPLIGGAASHVIISSNCQGNSANSLIMGGTTPAYGKQGSLGAGPSNVTPFPFTTAGNGLYAPNTVPSFTAVTSTTTGNLSINTIYSAAPGAGAGTLTTANAAPTYPIPVATGTDYNATTLICNQGGTTPAGTMATVTWTYTYDEA